MRRVVIDSAGVVVDMGRKRRLFTGAARDANGYWHTYRPDHTEIV